MYPNTSDRRNPNHHQQQQRYDGYGYGGNYQQNIPRQQPNPLSGQQSSEDTVVLDRLRRISPKPSLSLRQVPQYRSLVKYPLTNGMFTSERSSQALSDPEYVEKAKKHPEFYQKLKHFYDSRVSLKSDLLSFVSDYDDPQEEFYKAKKCVEDIEFLIRTKFGGRSEREISNSSCLYTLCDRRTFEIVIRYLSSIVKHDSFEKGKEFVPWEDGTEHVEKLSYEWDCKNDVVLPPLVNLCWFLNEGKDTNVRKNCYYLALHFYNVFGNKGRLYVNFKYDVYKNQGNHWLEI